MLPFAVTQNTLYISHRINTRIYFLQPCSLQPVTASAQLRRSSTCPSISSSISALRDNKCTHLPDELSAKQHIDFHAVHLSRERLLFSSHQCLFFILFSSIPSRIHFLFYFTTIAITTVQGGCRLAPISISTTGDTDTGKPKEPSIYLSILINSIYPRIHSPRSRDPRFEKFSRCFYVSSATRSSLYLGFLYCFIIGLACFHSHSKSQHTRFSGAGSLLFLFLSLRTVWLGAEHDT